MVIVGLQCGHDSAVTILGDGKVLLHLERERVSRRRHDVRMDPDLIHLALAWCGLAPQDVDCFALCTTQSRNYVSEDVSRLRFDYRWETAEQLGIERFRRTVYDRAVELAKTGSQVGRLQSERSGPADSRVMQSLHNSEWPDMADVWRTTEGMRLIDRLDDAALGRLFTHTPLADAYTVPMTVTFEGHRYPAVGIMHHAAHAAAAYYQSPFDAAPVFTHDNGVPTSLEGPYKAAMLFYGEGRFLRPLWTAPVVTGFIYYRSAIWAGFSKDAGPGKLMGLSAYGQPRLYDSRFIGDVYALADLYGSRKPGADKLPIEGWLHTMALRAQRQGYEWQAAPFSDFGKDLAATAQKTFEELVLYVLERLETMLTRTGRMGPELCLSGGCALNCPANSRIVEETRFDRLAIPPSCDDGGLSTGAALYLYHHVLGHERVEIPALDRNIAPLGRSASAPAIADTLRAAAAGFTVEPEVNVAERAAEDLAADRVVALAQGRSESGPRALGHRSLLADPRRKDNWGRVNELKRREWWRPFAPACLAERLREHFDGGPPASPHMLFNYRVRSDALPAVTHVDGTARTQTVARDAGMFRSVIEAFERRTDVPVVLNTSLNGPGEPIVDTPADCLNFMRGSNVDVLYLENNRIARRTG